MKKTYLKPLIEATAIELQGMIAASDPQFGGPGSGNADSRGLNEFEDDLNPFGIL
jgi:hypothetical protein